MNVPQLVIKKEFAMVKIVIIVIKEKLNACYCSGPRSFMVLIYKASTLKRGGPALKFSLVLLCVGTLLRIVYQDVGGVDRL
jgi:hypothetical protein